MTVEELVKIVAEWCSENGSAESSFLYPNPQHFVYTFGLFDMLVKTTGISEDQIGEWFNAAQEAKTAARIAREAVVTPSNDIERSRANRNRIARAPRRKT